MTQSLAAVVEATCGALARVPVRVSGAWQPDAALSGGWTRRTWLGLARADEPMVVLLLAGVADKIDWHKSERPRRPGADCVDGLEVRLGITVEPGQPLVGLAASVHGAHAGVTAPLPDSATSATVGFLQTANHSTEGTGSTGVLFDLIAFHGAPHVTFSLLFIAAAQVSVGRNGLWRVRRSVAPALHEPLRTILSRGRCGVIALDS